MLFNFMDLMEERKLVFSGPMKYKLYIIVINE